MNYLDYKKDVKRTEAKVLDEYRNLYRDVLGLFEKLERLGKLSSTPEESFDYYNLLSNNSDISKLKSLLLALKYIQNPYDSQNVMDLKQDISSKYVEQFKK